MKKTNKPQNSTKGVGWTVRNGKPVPATTNIKPESKARRKMAKHSRKINRRKQ
jgi:hypothetical protein